MSGILAKHLSTGTWECRVRYRNHISQTHTVYVNQDVMTRLLVKLEPKAA